MPRWLTLALILFVAGLSINVYGQDVDENAPAATNQTTGDIVEDAKDKIGEATDQINDKLDDLAETVNESEQAQDVKAGILEPIYKAAEYMEHPAFYWIAFAFMVAGLISFALQLVLGKLFMLLQFRFSLVEILADGLGFAISAIGLVLTTQAATQNSSFTHSAFSVLSAAAIGVFFGLIFYIRGQTQEFREAREVRRRQK